MLKAALAGIGGFGVNHLDAMEALQRAGELQLCAVCEARPETLAAENDRLTRLGARIYKDYGEMLMAEKGLDFVAISTPIPLHKPMAIGAMNAGMNVLLEKPPAVTLPDLEEMLAAQRKNGVMCAVDFLMTASGAFRALLELAGSGTLGTVTDITAVGISCRPDTYYNRASWTGKWTLNGANVRDGVMNNVHPHILNNSIALARSLCGGDLRIRTMHAELYRSHPIETEDTACFRAEIENGPKLHFYGTLCYTHDTTPYVRATGTTGSAVWNYENVLETIYGDGRRERTKFGEENNLRKVYDNFITALKTGDASGLYSPLEAARAFIKTTDSAYASSGRINDVPAFFVAGSTDAEGGVTPVIKGIKETVEAAAESGALFSELPDAPAWAAHSRKLNLI